MNLLLKSLLASPAPGRGPNIPLTQETLEGLNLTTGVTNGSLSLGKDEGKIDWTETLGDAVFDTPRKRFSENFAKAMKGAQTGEKPARSLLQDLQADLKTLDALLVDQVRELSPDNYIASRRLLNKLKVSLTGLGDSQVVAACNSSWKKNVRNVADLVGYCQQHGVEFGPAAAPGDPPCYSVAYLAFRAYERGTVQVASGQ